jgi:hypothetical protein
VSPRGNQKQRASSSPSASNCHPSAIAGSRAGNGIRAAPAPTPAPRISDTSCQRSRAPPHVRQRPRKASQARTGTSSSPWRRRPQWSQAEGARTMSRPCGRRWTSVPMNEPTIAPRTEQIVTESQPHSSPKPPPFRPGLPPEAPPKRHYKTMPDVSER